jgi:hypothetical protein
MTVLARCVLRGSLTLAPQDEEGGICVAHNKSPHAAVRAPGLARGEPPSTHTGDAGRS